MQAINRYTIPKEINKIIDGYDIPLRWNYNTTTSFEHPIMKILIRRIQMAENKSGNALSESEVFRKWFPLKYYREDSVAYILNFTWNKPRDIVRLLITARDSIKSNNTKFSVDVINTIIKPYSMKCLEETQEEMRAVYSNERIDEIVQCFRGFRTRFTFQDLQYHINRNHHIDEILDNMNGILRDLYRIGFIGNYSGLSDSHHWQHKGDIGLLFTDEWQMQIHRALWGALQISNRHDISANKIPQYSTKHEGKIVNILIDEVESDFVRGSFEINGESFRGIIFKSNISTQYVKRITDYIQSGYTTEAQIVNYDKNYKIWVLTKIY